MGWRWRAGVGMLAMSCAAWAVAAWAVAAGDGGCQAQSKGTAGPASARVAWIKEREARAVVAGYCAQLGVAERAATFACSEAAKSMVAAHEKKRGWSSGSAIDW